MYNSKLIQDPAELIRNSIHEYLVKEYQVSNVCDDARKAWILQEAIKENGKIKIEVDSDGGECLVSVSWNPREHIEVHSIGTPCVLIDSEINWLLYKIALGCKIDKYEYLNGIEREIHIGIQYDCGEPNGRIWKGFYISIM